MAEPTPEQTYAERTERFAAARDLVAARWSRLANWRLVAIVAALGCLAVGWARGPGWLVWAGAALVAVFLALVARHNRLDAERRRCAALHTISLEGLARLRRDWSALPLRAPAAPPDPALPLAPFAADLDLLGPASLQQLLGVARTPAGLETLQRWLLSPAAPDTIRARQEAVAELAPQIELRDALALAALRPGEQERFYAAFLEWAASPPWLLRRPALLWLGRISSALFLAGVLAQLTGLSPLPLWGAPLILNMLLTLLGRRTLDTVGQLVDRQELLGAYAELFGLVRRASFQSPELRRLQAALSAGGAGADAQLRRIGRVAILAEYSRSILAPVLQLGLLWSFHVSDLAERWRRDAGAGLGPWLRALGEFEALAALAALRHDHPGWRFPEIADDGGPPELHARGLAHPLLPPDGAVANDVALGPPGRFLLITGSNMAGKSTLLRALGLNIVLAQAGGPVCAEGLRLPPLALATSMRVQDSLAQGVSYFMAELRRLKLVVDRAEAARAGGPACCYLLDEILHGTNSAERQVAARRVIRHLVGLGAIGAVSTHDLALADDPAIGASAELAHFTEQVAAAAAELRFDYRLRPGLAPTTNALRLMALVGLPTGEPSGTGDQPVP